MHPKRQSKGRGSEALVSTTAEQLHICSYCQLEHDPPIPYVLVAYADESRKKHGLIPRCREKAGRNGRPKHARNERMKNPDGRTGRKTEVNGGADINQAGAVHHTEAIDISGRLLSCGEKKKK